MGSDTNGRELPEMQAGCNRRLVHAGSLREVHHG
jgi:hypothetical protein